MLAAIHAVIEDHSDGALMLRTVLLNSGLVAHARKMLRMTRRETIMLAGFDMEQFIHWISIGQPGGSLLIGGE